MIKIIKNCAQNLLAPKCPTNHFVVLARLQVPFSSGKKRLSKILIFHAYQIGSSSHSYIQNEDHCNEKNYVEKGKAMTFSLSIFFSTFYQKISNIILFNNNNSKLYF